MKHRLPPTSRHAKGFIIGYLLFGLSLLSVVTVALVAMNDRQVEARILQEQREDLVTQAQTVRTVILNCALLYPAGDNGDAQSAIQFPKTPDSGLVTDLVCPGAPTSSGSPMTVWQTLTRSGAASISPPTKTMGLTAWKYSNGKSAGGQIEVFFYIESDGSTDTARQSLLQSLSYNRQLKDFMFIENANGNTRLRSLNLVNSAP